MGKKGGNTTVQSYQPTEHEVRLQQQAADYSEAVAPNALWLNNTAREMLEDSMGTVKVDYNALNQNALNQIGAAQQGVANLANGVLPANYQANMENAIRSGVENTMGKTLNSLGSRGVLNSSVTNTAMNDISKNASDVMAQQYANNISALNGLYGQMGNMANSQIASSAAAQEAARAPSLEYWNASMGLNSNGTLGALSAVAGQGTKTTTQTGGSGLFGNIIGAVGQGVSAYYGACFTEETMVRRLDEDGAPELVPIRRIKLGDMVEVYGIDGDRMFEKVIKIMEPRYSDVYTVVTDLMMAVHTTLSQPLMTNEGDMVEVSMMKIGTHLKNVGRVTGITRSGERKVYDFRTDGYNRYIVNGGFIAKGM